MQVFKQQIDYLHKQTEAYVDLTGVYPFSHGDSANGSARVTSDKEKKALLPLVEFDHLELEVSELLTNDGGLQNEGAAKSFLNVMKRMSLDSHKMLCISILKNTRMQPSLSMIAQGDGFRIIGGWLKVCLFRPHRTFVVEMCICSPQGPFPSNSIL